jgi:hypothetical protein
MYPPARGPSTGPIKGPRKKKPIAFPRSLAENMSVMVLCLARNKMNQPKKSVFQTFHLVEFQKTYPAPTACAALEPAACDIRNIMKTMIFGDKAQPTVEAT